RALAVAALEQRQDPLPRAAPLVGRLRALPLEVELAVPRSVPQHLAEGGRQIAVDRARRDAVAAVEAGLEDLVPVRVAPGERALAQRLALVDEDQRSVERLAHA